MALSFFWQGSSQPDLTAEQLYSRYIHHSDVSALEQLVALYGDALYHFLLRQSDRALAEDISQQCWLKLVNQKAAFSGQSSFKTWLFSMARHCLIDELRRLQRWQWQPLPDDTSTEQLCLAEQLANNRYQLQFSQWLAALPFAQREALMLQLEGFSLTEICQITVQPAETVKSRLRYARQFLQQCSSVKGQE
ncbi:sigma-70 family RNA polymerase sigma factor [Rheinheimera gaetbuli]